MDREINLDDLQKIINIIFENLKKDNKFKGQIPLVQDNYWEISQSDRHDLSKDTSVLRLESGQLYDDWDFLTPILNDENQGLSYCLIHVAPLLRYIAEHVPLGQAFKKCE